MEASLGHNLNKSNRRFLASYWPSGQANLWTCYYTCWVFPFGSKFFICNGFLVELNYSRTEPTTHVFFFTIWASWAMNFTLQCGFSLHELGSLVTTLFSPTSCIRLTSHNPVPHSLSPEWFLSIITHIYTKWNIIIILYIFIFISLFKSALLCLSSAYLIFKPKLELVRRTEMFDLMHNHYKENHVGLQKQMTVSAKIGTPLPSLIQIP